MTCGSQERQRPNRKEPSKSVLKEFTDHLQDMIPIDRECCKVFTMNSEMKQDCSQPAGGDNSQSNTLKSENLTMGITVESPENLTVGITVESTKAA